MAQYAGFAWRDSLTATYTIVTPSAPTTGDAPAVSNSPSVCTGNGGGQANLRTYSLNGRTGDILDLKASSPSGAQVGSSVFMWQRVTYTFASSTKYPGFVGLWRNVDGAAAPEELLAPFDGTASFRFFASGADTSVVVPPAVSTIVGLDLVLNAISSRVVSDNVSSHSMSKVRTSVFFKNVRTY
jgi:hypothetical protein